MFKLGLSYYLCQWLHYTFNSLANGVGDEKQITVELDSQVKSIKFSSSTSKAKISLTSGQEYEADSVIVTVPLGVLKAGTIEFDPPLPEAKQQAINNLGEERLQGYFVFIRILLKNDWQEL